MGASISGVAGAAPEPPSTSSTPASAAGSAPLAAGPTPSPRDEASASFNRGLDLLRQGAHADALAAFERAYELSPVYQVLYYIGAMNVQLQRWASARRSFELYLKLGGPHLSRARVEEVNVHLDELTRKTATLTLTLNVPGASVRVDGSPVHPTDVAGLVVDPGEHVVYVTKPGFEPLEQVLRATDGENVHLVLPLAPINGGDSTPRPHQLLVEPRSAASMLPADRVADRAADEVVERMPLWLPWLVTGALASGWLTTAGLSIKARHDRDRIERPEVSDERIEDARRLHMTLAVVSDVFLASTLASAGVSAYLTWWPESDAPPPRASGAPAGSVADGLSLGVSGRF